MLRCTRDNEHTHKKKWITNMRNRKIKTERIKLWPRSISNNNREKENLESEHWTEQGDNNTKNQDDRIRRRTERRKEWNRTTNQFKGLKR